MGMAFESKNILTKTSDSLLMSFATSLSENIEKDIDRFSSKVLQMKLDELYETRCNLLDAIAHLEKLERKFHDVSCIIADGISHKTGKRLIV